MSCVLGGDSFGISPTAGLTAFKLSFAGLALPYSMTQGESFVLKPTVFNCLKKCIWVRSLIVSSGFPLSFYKSLRRHMVNLELV